ncbi:helix-turn-helix transcriptional regulator [Bacillus thuringiensis]|uniref:helix-turn-helix domain-containing protein n=1 Tax=Bacillus thuringiensis TaxID=1428 RepID=UPI0010AB6BD2|nr:helix-turn-helix transcriptional regulator [Bacillus thuringiensis]TJZ99872.1 helix-turn-helix transcriptional regulator [Bacillus thuringiensis]
MDIDKKAVGMRIAEIRRDKGLTLEEFGKLVDNAGKSIVSKWEKGSTLPNNKRIKIISEIGDITIDDLLYGNMENFIFNNLENFFPDGEKFLPSIIPALEIRKLAHELEQNNIKISNIEEVKKTINSKIPQWKVDFQKEVNNYLKLISNHKDLKKQVYEIIQSETSSLEKLSLVDEVFEHAKHFSFEDKMKLFRSIQDIVSVLETLINNEFRYTDTFAFPIEEEAFIKTVGNLNVNLENMKQKQHLYYKIKNSPFPSKENHFEILVRVNNNNKCDLLTKNCDLLIHYFPEFKQDFLNKYFKETHISIVYKDDLYFGFLDSNLTFKTTISSEIFEINLKDNFKSCYILPTSAIFY